MNPHLIPPHGGRLIDLITEHSLADDLKAASRNWLSWDLTPRQVCDLELLLNGGFSPLEGFMRREDYEAVCSSMHLADGGFWPMPIVLDIDEQTAASLLKGDANLALRDSVAAEKAVVQWVKVSPCQLLDSGM